LNYYSDVAVDVCKCGDLMVSHWDSSDYWITGIKRSGCKECDCPKKQFDYTTSLNEFCKVRTKQFMEKIEN